MNSEAWNVPKYSGIFSKKNSVPTMAYRVEMTRRMKKALNTCGSRYLHRVIKEHKGREVCLHGARAARAARHARKANGGQGEKKRTRASSESGGGTGV